MTKHWDKFMAFAFLAGFAFELGGQAAWLIADVVKVMFNIPLG